MIEPRFRSVASYERSLGPECVAHARAGGLVLDDWQAVVPDGLLALDAAGRFAHFEGGMNVARQNGKGAILEAVELHALFEWPCEVLIVHSAHEFATAQEHQLRLEALIQNAPHLHARVKDRGGYKHANGQESINLRSGSRIIFKARTKGGTRGFSADLLVWDEAMVLPYAVVGAMMPTLRASDAPYGPLIVYAGSAVDQEIHEHGLVWARIRERGIAGEPGLAYFEWSAPFEHPSEMTEEDFANLAYMEAANPALGSRISREHMDREIASMVPRTAAVELYGVGDWPSTDGTGDEIITLEAWDERCDLGAQMQPGFCLAFDVSPERSTAIAIAGVNQRGEPHVEIHEHRPGTSWVVPRVVEMVERGDPELVVCDGVGPAASLIKALDKAGVKVEAMQTPEHSQSCGRLVDMVENGSLTHLGSEELRQAIRGAKTRTIGDGAWAWGRRSSSVDISPLVAATLALGAAAGIAYGPVEIF